MSARRSSCAPPLISTPFRAAAASAETIETGVEMTSAQGQADDEEHERPVNPRAPAAESGERRQDGHDRRQDEHRRRVDAREPIDEGLARRALRLCTLDEMNDPRDGGVGAEPPDPHFERRRGR